MSDLRAALTIAGSDSIAGAGIQADLKTFTALGVYGTSALTAVTAQNTTGIVDIVTLPADFVTAQIEAVAGDITLHAVKTGMLATAAIVEAVAAAIKSLELPRVVVDPVMVSTSGAHLLDDDGVLMMRTELIPCAAVVTPNIPEAEILSGRRIESIEQARAAAVEIHQMGASAVVITGGHAWAARSSTCCSTARSSRNCRRRESTRRTLTAPAAPSRRPSRRSLPPDTRWSKPSSARRTTCAGRFATRFLSGTATDPWDTSGIGSGIEDNHPIDYPISTLPDFHNPYTGSMTALLAIGSEPLSLDDVVAAVTAGEGIGRGRTAPSSPSWAWFAITTRDGGFCFSSTKRMRRWR